MKLSLKSKLVLALSSIAVALLVSSIISVMAYQKMSNYVSMLIADNISSINAAHKLAEATDAYNLEILSVVGDETRSEIPYFDTGAFVSCCDSIKMSLASQSLSTLADSILYSYSAYILTSLELEDVLKSDFTDSRSWFFNRLQPKYDRLSYDINSMSEAIFDELEKNSASFDRAIYQSDIPGIVAVGVGLLLLLLFLFFMISNYVNPLEKMLAGLRNYMSSNKKYTVSFDGDDQLAELNGCISEITNENQQYRKRISAMRDALRTRNTE